MSIAINDRVQNFCWQHFGDSAENTVGKHFDGRPRPYVESETASWFKYKDRYTYIVRDTGNFFSGGLEIFDIFDDWED